MKRVPLVLLHGCGGSARDFAAFADALPPEVRPLPLELPGRGARAHLAPALSAVGAVAALAREVEPEVVPAADGFAVYGTGLGAFLGLALIRRLEDRTAARCRALFVSGIRGPFGASPLLRRPDPAGPPPAEVEVHAAAAALGVPWPNGIDGPSAAVLRADVAVHDCFARTLRRSVVECDITAFHRPGSVSVDCLRAWRASTTESLELLSEPGWALSAEERDRWRACRTAQRLLPPAVAAPGAAAPAALAGRPA